MQLQPGLLEMQRFCFSFATYCDILFRAEVTIGARHPPVPVVPQPSEFGETGALLLLLSEAGSAAVALAAVPVPLDLSNAWGISLACGSPGD